MNPTIGQKLKKYREISNLTVDEVCEKLSLSGFKVSPKTLYGYENNVSSPKISLFITLCNLYGVKDISGEFGYSPAKTNHEFSLTPHERTLIIEYRKRPEVIQQSIDRILEIESEPLAKERGA